MTQIGAMSPFFAANASAAPKHELSEFVRDGAFPVIPDELRELVQAEDTLIDLQERLGQPSETYGTWLTQVGEDLVAGNPLPDDFADAAKEAADREDRHAKASLALGHLQAALARRWTTAAEKHVDAMLAGLRSQLDQLLTEVRSAAGHIASLDLTDPEATAAASDEQRAAILALRELRSRYDEIRTLQRRLVQAVQDNPGRFGYPEVSTAWRHVWRSRLHEFSGVREHAPQPDPNPQRWYIDLIERDDVWLPTFGELRDAWGDIYQWHAQGA